MRSFLPEQRPHLQISVNDSSAVKVVNGTCDLGAVEASPILHSKETKSMLDSRGGGNIMRTVFLCYLDLEILYKI